MKKLRKRVEKMQKRGYFAAQEEYLFQSVREEADVFFAERPEKKRLDLGVGDVFYPLFSAGVAAMKRAAEEMGTQQGFRGYPPANGYEFLRRAVAGDYQSRGIPLGAEDFFISDGAKTHLGFFATLFPKNLTVFLQTPVYPVYRDTSAARGKRIRYLAGKEENGFLPPPPWFHKKPCLIYLCSPNNPTGSAYSEAQLSEFVDYCKKTDSFLIYDAAYSPFMQEEGCCRTIFEVAGASECAAEVASFSKSAGMTGVRCGYTAIFSQAKCAGVPVKAAFSRLLSTEQNGVSYLSQRCAEAAFSPQGKGELAVIRSRYRANAERLSKAMKDRGAEVFGGRNAPYLWVKAPRFLSGKAFCRILLERAGIVAVPGEGFGVGGEGFVRFSALVPEERVKEAVNALHNMPRWD